MKQCHITQIEPKFLKDKPEISQDEAINKVCSFLGIEKSHISVTGESNGNLKTYNLAANDINISITKQGGYINSIINPRTIAEATIGFDTASNNAKEFLAAHNINNMSESYYVISNGICTINFAYKKNDIIYYPDLIKVGVALDTGEIISLNSTGYLMNHTERTFDSNIIDSKSAQNNVSPLLQNITILLFKQSRIKRSDRFSPQTCKKCRFDPRAQRPERKYPQPLRRKAAKKAAG